MTKKLIGLDPDQVPVNGFLGDAAYFDTEHLPLSNQAKPLYEAFSGFENLVDERPSLMLDFVRSETLPGRVQFTRPSDATYFDRTGKLRTAGSNQPRIEFDPVTGKCLGLLVERQATNLLLWSKDFTNSAWSHGNVTLRDSGIPSVIDGTTWTELEANTDGNRYISQSVTVVGTISAFTYFRKSETEIYGFIFISGAVVRLNLKSGLATVTSGSVDSFAVEEVNDSFKLRVTKTYEEESSFSFQIGLRGALAGQKTLFAGAQLEAGTRPTSYIPTEGSQVTRAADSTIIPTNAFPFNPSQGTFVVSWTHDRDSDDKVRSILKVQKSSALQWRGMGVEYYGPRIIRALARDVDRGIQSTPSITASVVDGVNVAAFRYSPDNFGCAFNGGAVGDIPLTSPQDWEGFYQDLVTVFIGYGARLAGGGEIEGRSADKPIARVTYFPRAFPDAKLVELSSTGGTHV